MRCIIVPFSIELRTDIINLINLLINIDRNNELQSVLLFGAFPLFSISSSFIRFFNHKRVCHKIEFV